MAAVQASKWTKHGVGYARRLPGRVAKKLTEPVLGSVRSVLSPERVVALTFDDGPHPEHTPRLLDVLAMHGAKATFFVVGAAAETYPEVTRRIAAEGHALANHTFDHRSVPLLSRSERLAQLRRCKTALEPFGGDNGLFRPPYGDQSLASRLDALRLGYEVVAWSQHCSDWLEHDSAFFSERLTAQLQPGSIFLLHDSLYRMAEPRKADRSAVIGAVEALLRARPDYAFVTVPELLKHGPARKTMWFKKPDPAWLAHVDPGGLPHVDPLGLEP